MPPIDHQQDNRRIRELQERRAHERAEIERVLVYGSEAEKRAMAERGRRRFAGARWIPDIANDLAR